MQAQIAKVDEDEHLVFGWAWVSTNVDGEIIVDSQGESIEPRELEKAAYDYVLNARAVNELHEGADIGAVVESFVFTPEKAKAMGLPAEDRIGWWIGVHVPDAEIFGKVKDGTYSMFSIEGVAGEIAEVVT